MRVLLAAAVILAATEAANAQFTVPGFTNMDWTRFYQQTDQELAASRYNLYRQMPQRYEVTIRPPIVNPGLWAPRPRPMYNPYYRYNPYRYRYYRRW